MVTIGGNTAPLRAAVAEAKQIATDASKIVANVTVKIDTVKLRTELQSAAQGLSLRVPVVLDLTQARSQLAQLGMGGAGGGQIIPYGASSPNFSMMIQQSANSIVSGLQPQSSPNWSYLMRPGAAAGGGAGGGNAGGGRAFGLFRPLAAGYLALRGAQNLARAYDREFIAPGETARYEGELAAKRLILSNARADENDGLGHFVRSLGPVQDIFGTNDEQRRRVAEQDVAKLEMRDRNDVRTRDTIRASRATSIAGLRGRAEIVGRFDNRVADIAQDARGERIKAKDEASLKGISPDSEVKSITDRELAQKSQARAEEKAALKRFDDEEAAEVRSSAREITSIRAEAANAQISLTQGSMAGQRAALKAGLDAEIQAVKDAIQKMRDAGAGTGVIAAEEGKLAALESAKKVKIDVQNQLLAREGKQFIASEKSSGRVASLSAAANPRAAAKASLSGRLDPELTNAIRKYGIFSPEVKALEEANKNKFAELDAGYSRSDTASIASSKAGARVAGLRAGQNNFLAEQTQFDATTAEQLQAMRNAGDPLDVINAKAAERASQRATLLSEQGRSRSRIVGGLNTRVSAADAEGKGFGAVAGLIGRIGGMREELSEAQPEFRGQIVAAQTAELRAMQQEATRPRNYATSFDVHHDVVGGPSGNGGEQVTYLKAIAEYMKLLLDKSGNSARYN